MHTFMKNVISYSFFFTTWKSVAWSWFLVYAFLSGVASWRLICLCSSVLTTWAGATWFINHGFMAMGMQRGPPDPIRSKEASPELRTLRKIWHFFSRCCFFFNLAPTSLMYVVGRSWPYQMHASCETAWSMYNRHIRCSSGFPTKTTNLGNL